MQQRPKRLVHIARERRAVGRIAHVVARPPVSNDSAGTFGLRTYGFSRRELTTRSGRRRPLAWKARTRRRGRRGCASAGSGRFQRVGPLRSAACLPSAPKPASDGLLDRTLLKESQSFGTKLLTEDIPRERDDRQLLPVDAGRFAQGDGDPLFLCRVRVAWVRIRHGRPARLAAHHTVGARGK